MDNPLPTETARPQIPIANRTRNKTRAAMAVKRITCCRLDQIKKILAATMKNNKPDQAMKRPATRVVENCENEYG